MTARRSVLLLMLSTMLGGCGGDDDLTDLKAFLEAERSRPQGGVEPITPVRPYEVFTYEASALRSPFQLSVKSDLANCQKGSGEVRPDPNRIKQRLEGFNIGQFEMVGTLSNAAGTFALMRGAGGVHRVKVGDYLGRNDGRIVSVRDAQVDIIEIVPAGEGAWQQRLRIIPLKERS